MISIVRNGIIILVPQIIPRTWTDPDTGIQWSNFENMSIDALDTLGRKDVVDSPLPFAATYEQSAVSGWRYDAMLDIVTRDYTITDRPLEDVRAERLAAVKAECRERILAVIDTHHQMDVALGIIPDLGYTSWITKMIIESNRCEDAYAAAQTIKDMRAVEWSFPIYEVPK